MEHAARLRADARGADERRLLVVAGDPERTRERARAAVAAADLRDVCAVGPAKGPWKRVEPDRTDRLLGTTREAVVLDCHGACRPNDIGRAVGAVDGGGLLLLLTPPLEDWPDRRDGFDDTLAVPPFEAADVTGHFRRRLVRTLRDHRGVAIVEGDTVRKSGLVDAAPRLPSPDPSPPDGHQFPAAAYGACLTRDQAAAVAAFEELLTGGAVVLEADRGRGKSSAAGLAAAALALGGRDVLVTAPRYRNAAELFARAGELLTDLGELAGRDGADRPRRLATETGRIRFVDPTTAAELPGDPDCVVVDEAAALPVAVLDAVLAADAVGFSTTVHGYEGAGRGFSVRFRDRLAEADVDVTECHLAEPVRYAPGDPVEVWSFRALALGARPAVDPVVETADPGSVEYRRVEPEAMLADEHRLREVFGLLVVAHYRTEPNDLARLLDAPNVAVRALTHGGHVVSVALLAREGGLDQALRASIYGGERVRGNMIPDVLTSQLRDEAAAEPVGYRVLRIATHRRCRSRGLGSRLLSEIRNEFDGADWLGVGYGATPDLVDFWTANGFSTVHLSTTRNAESGEHSAVMLDPRSPAGRRLHDRHAAWFLDRAGPMLSDPLDGLDPDVVRAALAGTAATVDPDLSAWEWRVAAGVATGRMVAAVDPRPVRRLALAAVVDGDVLTAREERLLVGRALQARPWPAVAEATGFASEGECKRAFGGAVAALVERYGTELALAELERFS